MHNFDKSFESPDSFTPTQDIQEQVSVTAVAWNCKIAHIFASAGNNGVTTVWDVKNKKSILTLSDPNFSLESFSTEGQR